MLDPVPSLSYVGCPVSYIVCYLVLVFILHISCVHVPCHMSYVCVLFPMAVVKFPLSDCLLTHMLYCFSRQVCAIKCAFLMFTYWSSNSRYFLCHMPYFIWFMVYVLVHMSYVLYHMSYVIYNISYVLFHILYFIFHMLYVPFSVPFH